MTKVTIIAENPGCPDTLFRASARDRESVGHTPGAALDELTRQLDEGETGTLVIVQNFRPDSFFTAAQQKQLQDLLGQWRAARASGQALPPGDQAQLESLVDAELDASARRSASIAHELQS